MENDNEVLSEEVETEEGTEEAPKKELSPEQLAGIKKRQFTKLAKELGIELPKPKEELKTEKPKEGFDYGEKAFLKASGIQSNEYELVERAMKSTGSTLDEILEDEFFQGRLKSLRETKATKEAIPQGSKRTGTSTRDSVDYWIAKGEMPPADQPKLRREYVNAKLKAEKAKSQFTSRSVV